MSEGIECRSLICCVMMWAQIGRPRLLRNKVAPLPDPTFLGVCFYAASREEEVLSVDGFPDVRPLFPSSFTLHTDRGKVQAELEGVQRAAEAGRAEKDEMRRLNNELLEQLNQAGEEREELQVGDEGVPTRHR